MADNNYIKIDGTMARIPQANKYTGLVDYIIQEEGFLSKPTDIGDGKITLGSGLTDPKWHQLYKKRGNKWSAEDNRRAVEEEVRKREKWLSDSFPNWDMLPKESQEALIAYKYNYDFTPTNSPEMYKAAKNKNFKALGYQINATSKDSKFQKGLEERRLRDQNLYFSGFNNVPSVHKVPYENRVYKAMQDKVNYHNFMNSISIQNNPQPTYNPPIKFDDGGELYYPKQWNDLTMAEKAEMMKVAVQNGITTLPEIRERYNEFAMGGYVPSNRIKDRITHYEGKAMTGAIDPLSGKYSNNNSFESEAKGFYNALPEDIRDQVLSNPELADSLYSYSYNVGAGNFKKRVVPTLRRYYQGNATVSDIERSMWASGDSKLRGLQRRRAEERAGVRSALTGSNPFYSSRFSDSEDLPFTPFYNEVFNTPLSSYDVPTVTLPIEEPLVQAAEDYAYSKEALDRQERQDRLNAFNMLLNMSSPNSSGNSLMDTIGMLTGRNFAQGGRKYDGLTQNSQQMSNPLKPNIFRRPDGSYFYQEKPSSQEINVTPMNTVFDDPSQWTYVDDEGRQYTPHQSSVNNTGTITQGEDNNPLVKAANNYFRELAYRSTYDPSSLALQGKYTMPAMAASALLPIAGEAAYPILTNPYVDAGITSAFGAHGLNKLFRGEINGPLDGAMTALEVAPLGRLAKPLWNAGKTTYNTGKAGLKNVVKAIDNTTRDMYAPYDLYKTVEETPIIERSFPAKSLYRADVYRGGKIRDPHNISLTTDPEYAKQYGEVTPYLFESSSVTKAKEPLMGYKDPVNNDMFIYYNTKDAPNANAIVGHDLVTGEFPHNSEGTEIISLSSNNIYPKAKKPSSINWENALNSSHSQITAENAASITPEQWTAAQDAAIARGDMAEAQRLRDLHFKVSAPDTKVDIPLWSSSEEPFNSFDLSHFGETDSGFFGYGHYLTPIEKYAATYHPVNRKFYVNVKNPYTGSNDQYFNRVQYVKDRLARRKENVMNNLRDGKLTRLSKKLGINENTSLEDAEHLVDKYIADETVKWNNKYAKYVNEFEGKDGVLSWRDIQGIPNKREGIYKEVVIPRGEQIKSADAITYDDNGIRIPLGERDNFNINDIRYGLLPFLGLGAAGALYEKQD